MSKGSRPRPIENKEEFSKNWDNIFGKKNAGVAQLAEHLPSKQDVVGSSPIARSTDTVDKEDNAN